MSKINKIFELLADEKKVKHILEQLYPHDAELLYEGFADNMLDFYFLLNDKYKQKLSDIIEKELENS